MKHKLQTFFKSKLHRVMALVFLLMLVLNVLTVKISDDFICSANHGFLDIFYREYVQYMTWTGRSVAHIIDRIFLALPKIIFYVCNSLMSCIHVFVIALHATGTKERIIPLRYGLIALAIFLLAPLFGQMGLWENGSIPNII